MDKRVGLSYSDKKEKNMKRSRLIADILHKKEVLKLTQKSLKLQDKDTVNLMQNQLKRVKGELEVLLDLYRMKSKGSDKL